MNSSQSPPVLHRSPSPTLSTAYLVNEIHPGVHVVDGVVAVCKQQSELVDDTTYHRIQPIP